MLGKEYAVVATGVRPGRPAPLRLTRRGRIVVLGLLILMGVLASTVLWTTAREAANARAAGGARVEGSVEAPAPVTLVAETRERAPERLVVVGSSDTLWSIARRLFPDRDPRQVVAELRALNGLTGSIIHAGQTLRLPSGP
jgi:Tfp pilus assembly protein FimV